MLHTLDGQMEVLPGQHFEGCRQEVWSRNVVAKNGVEWEWLSPLILTCIFHKAFLSKGERQIDKSQKP